MPQSTQLALADAVLAMHVAIILFNVFGLVAIPIGSWRGWRWVRALWWRALHVAALALVALQALLGRACFLTLWQTELLGTGASPTPLVMRWVDRLVFWPLPVWVFAVLYVAVFLYVIALWRLVPPTWPGRRGCSRPRRLRRGTSA